MVATGGSGDGDGSVGLRPGGRFSNQRDDYTGGRAGWGNGGGECHIRVSVFDMRS